MNTQTLHTHNNNMTARISCIMPAYNEADRIESVLKAVHNHPLIHEIIVVDDGSTDMTADIVSRFEHVRLVSHSVNQGKIKAVYSGLQASYGEYIFLLDTDLIGLTSVHITSLLEPIISGKADVSISMRGNTQWYVRLLGIDYISGERVFPRHILEDHPDDLLRVRGYGLEVYINMYIIARSYRIQVVFWKDVSNPLPRIKYGFIAETKKDITMLYDMMSTVSLPMLAYQQIRMILLTL